MQPRKIAWTILTLVLIACGEKPTMPGEEEKQIALLKIAAMNQHDLEGIGKFYADSARIQSTGFEPTEIGPSGIQGVYKRYFTSTPDLRFEISRITTTEGAAVIEYTSAGTLQQSPLEDVIPAYMVGKKYTLQNCTRIDIKDGKIVSEMTYFDQVAFLRQMGFFDQR
jgi:steroid delta-isomerase-like uncharacterized protein